MKSLEREVKVWLCFLLLRADFVLRFIPISGGRCSTVKHFSARHIGSRKSGMLVLSCSATCNTTRLFACLDITQIPCRKPKLTPARNTWSRKMNSSGQHRLHEWLQSQSRWDRQSTLRNNPRTLWYHSLLLYYFPTIRDRHFGSSDEKIPWFQLKLLKKLQHQHRMPRKNQPNKIPNTSEFPGANILNRSSMLYGTETHIMPIQ